MKRVRCRLISAREHEFVIEAVDDFLKKREIAENRRPLEHFTEAASEHRAFAQELPRFVSEVRRMFTAEQIAGYPIALRLGSHVGRRGHVSCGADYGDAYDCIRKY